jgi:hypothetical protein
VDTRAALEQLWSADFRAQVTAIRRLAEHLDDPAVAEEIADCLEDLNPAVVDAACEALVRRGGTQGLGLLLGFVASMEHPRFVLESLETLLSEGAVAIDAIVHAAEAPSFGSESRGALVVLDFLSGESDEEDEW